MARVSCIFVVALLLCALGGLNARHGEACCLRGVSREPLVATGVYFRDLCVRMLHHLHGGEGRSVSFGDPVRRDHAPSLNLADIGRSLKQNTQATATATAEAIASGNGQAVANAAAQAQASGSTSGFRRLLSWWMWCGENSKLLRTPFYCYSADSQATAEAFAKAIAQGKAAAAANAVAQASASGGSGAKAAADAFASVGLPWL